MRCPPNKLLMRCFYRRSNPIIIPKALAAFVLVVSYSLAHSQTFDELKQLPAYQKLTTEGTKSRKSSEEAGIANPNTNFGGLWSNPRNASSLLSWLQAKIPGYKYTETSVGLLHEHAGAQALLYNKQYARVRIDVLVPRVEYTTMAQYNTLRSFNQFRPPTLDVIADQVVPIQGMEANYYRTRKGECSLLFKVERLGIVNLAVEKCSDSKVMMDVAKQLNFARLNQKLLS